MEEPASTNRVPKSSLFLQRAKRVEYAEPDPLMSTTDNDYKKMMTWVAIALVLSVIAALAIVHFVMRAYAQ